MSKYKSFLNILSIGLLIIAILIAGYMAYDYISHMILTKEAEEAAILFESQFTGNTNVNEEQNAIIVDIENVQDNQIANEQIVNNIITNTTPNTTPNTIINVNSVTYKGFKVVGSIQIPKTNILYPVVDTITANAIAVAVTAIYGPGLNEVRKYGFSST